MLKKTILFLLIITILATFIVGCGEKPVTVDPSKTDDSKSELDPANPTTFTMFYGFATGNEVAKKDTKTQKYIKDKTGITLDIEYLKGDLKTRVGVLVSSGDYPDYIWGHEAQNKFIEAQACVPMNDYIEKYGDNIKKVYGEKNIQLLKQEDGNIYFITPYVEDSALEKASQGFWIQKAVLKDANYPKIQTLDEYFTVLDNYKKKNPKIGGKSTIGFSILTDDWRFFCLTNPPSYLMGYPNDGAVVVDPTTYEAKEYSRMDESKAYYKKLNDMYNKGMVDEESFSMNYDQYIAKLSSGRVLGFYDQEWQITAAQEALEKQKLFERTYVALPLLLDPTKDDQYQNPPIYGTRDGVSISKNCKDPVKAFKFLNWILNEEVQKMTFWGFEGVDYTVGENGIFQRTDEQVANMSDKEYRRENGIGFLNYPWPRGINTSKYSDGNYWQPSGSPEEVNALYDESEKEVLKAYGVKTFSEMFDKPKPNPWGVAWDIVIPDDSEIKTINTKRENYLRKSLPKLIMATPSKFESLWSKHVSDLNKMGIEKYEKFLTDEIKKRVEKVEKAVGK